jgi:hypothetical protein
LAAKSGFPNVAGDRQTLAPLSFNGCDRFSRIDFFLR